MPGLIHAITNRHLEDEIQRQTKPQALHLTPPRGFLRTLGIAPKRLYQLHQSHSDRFVVIDHEKVISLDDCRTQQGDGIIVTVPGCYAAIRTADCVPLLVVLPSRKKVCLIHAGWRGTCDRIAAKAVRKLLEISGANPEELWLALGPCIRRCCYQVGQDVGDRFREEGHDVSDLFEGGSLDLVKANLQQLRELGVVRILDAGMCTACRPDLFYSYRREGATGRMWTIAGFES